MKSNRELRHAPVRWRDDTGWEFRCSYCAGWWPLADEFWRKRAMSRCRACWLEYQRRYQRVRYAVDPTFRADKCEAARITAWKERVTNPDRMAARKRRYYLRHRDRILSRERLRYQARKDAA